MCNNGVVVVAVNKVKPFTHASGYRNVAPQSGAVVSGFFIAHPTSVLRTLVSTPVVVARKESVHGMSKD
jgi:hypothetical protein